MKKGILLNFLWLLLCMVYTNRSHAQCYELVWSDEFDYIGLPDNTKWGYDVGGDGWGNNELQYYTNARMENAQVKDGKLTIKAIKEDYLGREYTSARLVSKEKGDWLYGRFEIRAKLPEGRGIWPAIWMLPTDWEYGGWPASGEIDIMEYVGYEPDVIHGTVHTGTFNHSKGTQKGASLSVPTAEEEFHVYAIEWTEDKIDFYVDDQVYFTFENLGEYIFMEWPFDKRFHLLLNVAVGGNWGGAQGVDNSIFPQQMEIDYVRVYSNPDFKKIKGETEVLQNESNLEYSIYPAEGAIYTWTVPDGVTIVENNNNSLLVNWGCYPGEITCKVLASCGSTDLVLPVKIEETAISGDFFFENNDTGKIFSIQPTGATSLIWNVPEDATITSGQNTEEITVDWGQSPGNVQLIQENACGTDTVIFFVYGHGQYPYPNPNQPHVLPGEINPANYDYGGEGVAYHDTEAANLGAGVRQDEGVDTQITDNGNDNIGWVIGGEWIEYSIAVEESGEYYFSLRTSSDNSSIRGPITVSVNGQNRIERMEVPYSGSWTAFDWLPTQKISLFDTDTVLRISVGNGNFNIGTIKIENENFVDVPDLIQSSFKIYPNPTNSQITITGEKKILLVKIVDFTGKVMMEQTPGTNSSTLVINTGYLSSGIYFVLLKSTSGELYQEKIIRL